MEVTRKDISNRSIGNNRANINSALNLVAIFKSVW